MPTWLQFIFVVLFTMFVGALLHSLTLYVPVVLIDQDLIGTICTFMTLTCFIILTLYMNIEISWMWIYILAGIFGLILAFMLNKYVKSNMHDAKELPLWHNVLIWGGTILFSIYIMYNTNVVLHMDYKGDYFQASLEFYLSFLNIFTRLL